MNLLIDLLIAVIAFQHACFLVLEMFFWTRPIGLKIFGQTIERATASSTLAANQGLYNGFLATGLVWALLHPSQEFSIQLKVFFLTCIIIAGVYGAYSVNKRIFFVQGIPAAIAVLLLVVK